MAETIAASEVSDGPVLNLINKRLRALRKKLNRITQIEEAISQGKAIIKEQEDVIRSKPSVTAAIDELDKLRQPLSAAVAEEVSLAVKRQPQEQGGSSQVDRQDEIVEDLVKLVYFGSMFDVKPQNDYTSTMLTRTHERSCCLTYDYVTDEEADLLGERDLDLISKIGGLVISRPLDSKLSHEKALEQCIGHAKLWIQKADQPIDSESSITYAMLKEKLTKIIGSDYLTKIPEMKGPGEVAAAAENYASFHIPLTVEGSAENYQHQQEEAANSEGNDTYNNQSSPTEQNKDEFENHEEVPSQTESLVKQKGEEGNDQGETDVKDHQNVGRRPYQNQRGGGGRGGGGRRGYYNNGRGGRFGGGRGGGGPYQNGRNQFYEQGGNYYPRNYHGNGRGGGRGGRGGGGTSYSNHGQSFQATNVPTTTEC